MMANTTNKAATKKPAAKKAAAKSSDKKVTGAATATGSAEPHLAREQLPIPDPKHVGLTTYDAKDPNTNYPPINDRCVRRRARPTS